ncbi:unnamed protein product [Vitrella brassicaformis CCMP3155]|uniref:Uncharacterized protein n=1 Tax=Vitrella brassicaformis (strain CCMP3155) TaxID=1169540 RepID=A0A0G4G829_VITBC|nr:unnamed protein product [Vitrella brassicaformis CCMP3155]|eukprot:CEM24663.1 unnamed protein product [Vitrella brassicaformis CCMP3155]
MGFLQSLFALLFALFTLSTQGIHSSTQPLADPASFIGPSPITASRPQQLASPARPRPGTQQLPAGSKLGDWLADLLPKAPPPPSSNPRKMLRKWVVLVEESGRSLQPFPVDVRAGTCTNDFKAMIKKSPYYPEGYMGDALYRFQDKTIDEALPVSEGLAGKGDRPGRPIRLTIIRPLRNDHPRYVPLPFPFPSAPFY